LGDNQHENDCLYQWWFLPFDLKNTFAKFLKVMDQALASFNFAKCYMMTPSYLANYKGSHASFVGNG